MTTEEEQKPKQDGIPLWSFLALVGGIGLCVGGYVYLKKRTSLPFPLPARDAFAQAITTAGDCACGRDLDMSAAPRAAAKYILTST